MPISRCELCNKYYDSDNSLNLHYKYNHNEIKYTSLDDLINTDLDTSLINKLNPYIKNLVDLIGQNKIKNNIFELINCKLCSFNLPNKPHTIISGNIGDGKSSFAEIIAEIYKILYNMSKIIKITKYDLMQKWFNTIKPDELPNSILIIDNFYISNNTLYPNLQNEIIDFLEYNMDINMIIILVDKKSNIEQLENSNNFLKKIYYNFNLESYSDSDFIKLLKKKVINSNLKFESDCFDKNLLNLNKKYFKYNCIDIEKLFSKCIIAHAKNLIKDPSKERSLLTKKDIEYGLELFINNTKSTNNISFEYLYN
jgi:adenylate kinase family enzyme